MRKNAPFILVFALLVVIYGISQYWNQNRSARFQAVLLDFLPVDISRIDLQKAADVPFSIRRNDNRWLMSKANVHETVKNEAVEELLQRLRSIRTSTIVTNKAEEWEEYGVANEQGVKICLHEKQTDPICLRLGRYTFSEQEKQLSVFTRLLGQKEVYAINGMSVSILDGNPDYFRNKQLIDLSERLDKMCWRQSDQEIIVSRRGPYWLDAQEEALDSILWSNYAQKMESCVGQHFADDIDETTMSDKLNWQLMLYTASDSIQLNCYRDSSRQEVFVIHSQQFPQTWLSSDSTGIYQDLVQPWLKILPENE